MKEITIETSNGTYVVRKPSGRIGAIHFSILQSCAPSGATDENGDVILSQADHERITDGFVKWSTSVLRQILNEKKSDFKYEEMPGEDQYAIFMAMMEDVNIGDEFFRVVE